MKPSDFFHHHRVFSHEEFRAACYSSKPDSNRAAERSLTYHLHGGRLLRIRRGLYLVLDKGADANLAATGANSFAIASRVAPDAVLAYHTALEFLGHAYALRNDRVVLTTSGAGAFQFGGMEYLPVGFPASLDSEEKRLLGVETHKISGMTIRVTGLERTLVDLLDKPRLAGGWEEIWRSFETAGFIDTEIVLQHVHALGNKTTAARVGWFLEEHQEEWMIPDSVLVELERLSPRSPVYITRSHRSGGKLKSRWNLVVPEDVIQRRWQEVL